MRRTTTAALALALALTAPACRDEAPPITPRADAAPILLSPETELPAIREAIATGRVHDAVARGWALVQDHPDHFDARLALAAAYQLAGRHAEALAEADRAAALDPASAGAQLTRGASLQALGRTDEAIAATEKVLALSPGHEAALANLVALYEAKQDWAPQAEVIEQLTKLRPDDPEVGLVRGRNLLRQDKAAEAEAALRWVLERRPDHGEAQLLMGLIAYEQGKTEVAMDRADIAARLLADPQPAKDLFGAAFFIGASAKLTCAHGAGPWTGAQIEAVLATYRKEGLTGAEAFHALNESFGARDDVKARITKAAEACRKGE